jgi:cytochrome c556
MRALIPTAFLGLMAAATAAATAAGARPPAAAPAAAPTTAQLVAARQAGMHMAATLLFRGIKAGVRNGADVKELVHEPEGLALWGAAIPGLFPAGSGHPDSRALASIWANKADFDRKAADLATAADKLAALARAGDPAGFAAQVPAVDAACAACHKAYRSE